MFFDFSKEIIVSAWIQGGCTVLAGGFALIAGCLAYCAATRQTRQEEKKQELKQKSYSFMIKTVLGNLLTDIKQYEGNYISGEVQKKVIIFLVPEEINPKNWENHSLLKDYIISMIHDLFTLLEKNYLYACFVKQSEHTKMFMAATYSPKDVHDPLNSEYLAKKSLDAIDDYNESPEGIKASIKCSDMNFEKYKENMKKIIIIIENIIKNIK